MGVSVQPINWGLVEGIGEGIGEGYSNRRLKRSMTNAKDVVNPDGTVNWDKASRVLLMDRPWEATSGVLGDSGFGAGDYGLNPQIYEDPDHPGQFISAQPGRNGQPNIVRDSQGRILRPLTGYQFLPDGRGGYIQVPKKGPVGGLLSNPIPSGQPGAANEEGATWTQPPPPSGETDPQAVQPPGPEWGEYIPSNLGPDGDFGGGVDGVGGSGIEGDEVYGGAGSVAPQRTTPPTKEQANVDEAVGDIKGKALQSIPGYENNLREMLRTLNQLEANPDLGRVTGAIQGRMPGAIQSERQAEVQSLIDLVTAKQWQQAFETLKGGGSITVEEGLSAAKAMSRLGAQQMGTPAYKEAIKDAKRQLWDLYNVIRIKAGKPQLENPFKTDKGTNSKVIDYRDWFGM